MSANDFMSNKKYRFPHLLLRKLCTTQSRLLTTLKKKPLENIVGEGENAGNSIFSFSHNVFSSIKNKFHHLGHPYIVV